MPTTLVITKSAAPRIERSTWLSAAKWTTASTSPISRSTRPRSQDVALHERAARLVLAHGGEVLDVARVGELVEHHDLVGLGTAPGAGEHGAHVVAADEPGTTGHQQSHRCPSRSRRTRHSRVPATSPVSGTIRSCPRPDSVAAIPATSGVRARLVVGGQATERSRRSRDLEASVRRGPEHDRRPAPRRSGAGRRGSRRCVVERSLASTLTCSPPSRAPPRRGRRPPSRRRRRRRGSRASCPGRRRRSAAAGSAGARHSCEISPWGLARSWPGP